MIAMNDEHDRLRSLIAPYALGALPEDEIRFVRAHILECEDCMADADAYFEAATSLSTAVEEVPVPAGFADRVLDLARGSAQGPASAPRRRTWRSAPALAIGALAVTALLLAGMVIDTRRALDRSENAFAAILIGEELRGEDAVGRLASTGEGSTLVIAGLPEAAEGRSYQLWFLRGDDAPVSAGVFDVSADPTVIDIDLRFEGYSGAAVSIEPEDGSTEPTGAIVLSNA